MFPPPQTLRFYLFSGLQIRVCAGKLFFLFLNQNICCGYSKEPSHWDGSFEHPKHMFKLMGKEINAILEAQTILSGPMYFLCCDPHHAPMLYPIYSLVNEISYTQWSVMPMPKPTPTGFTPKTPKTIFSFGGGREGGHKSFLFPLTG